MNKRNTPKDSVETPDWTSIPAPVDDGAARHLVGTRVPQLALQATDGTMVALWSLIGRSVVYIYPRTGKPGEFNPDGWDMIPGARGCTPQSCAFRDHFADLRHAGADHIFGLSTQSSAYQLEVVERLHLPFPILSDAQLELSSALELPSFEVNGITLLKRLTIVIKNGVIEHIFYPVFPPDKNAAEVVTWLGTVPR